MLPTTVASVRERPASTEADSCATGETDATSGAPCGSASARTSPVVSGRPLVPALSGGWRGRTVMLLAPRPAIWPWMYCDAPLPSAVSRMTAAIPMMIPSIVSSDRSRFAMRPRTAKRTISTTLIVGLLPR